MRAFLLEEYQAMSRHNTKQHQWHSTAKRDYPKLDGLYRVRIMLSNGKLHTFENYYSLKHGFTFDNTMRDRGDTMRILEWHDGWEN